VCAEASSVLRAVAEDFFFNSWCLEIPSDNRIRHVPRCVLGFLCWKWKPHPRAVNGRHILYGVFKGGDYEIVCSTSCLLAITNHCSRMCEMLYDGSC
jgi:hypothetical protein